MKTAPLTFLTLLLLSLTVNTFGQDKKVVPYSAYIEKDNAKKIQFASIDRKTKAFVDGFLKDMYNDTTTFFCGGKFGIAFGDPPIAFRKFRRNHIKNIRTFNLSNGMPAIIYDGRKCEGYENNSIDVHILFEEKWYTFYLGEKIVDYRISPDELIVETEQFPCCGDAQTHFSSEHIYFGKDSLYAIETNKTVLELHYNWEKLERVAENSIHYEPIDNIIWRSPLNITGTEREDLCCESPKIGTISSELQPVLSEVWTANGRTYAFVCLKQGEFTVINELFAYSENVCGWMEVRKKQ